MDMLSAIKIIEDSNCFTRNVENIVRLNGFREVTVPVWRVNDGTDSVSVTVDENTIEDVWKVFLIDDLEGIFYLVVMRKYAGKYRGKFVHDLFVLVDIENLIIS